VSKIRAKNPVASAWALGRGEILGNARETGQERR